MKRVKNDGKNEKPWDDMLRNLILNSILGEEIKRDARSSFLEWKILWLIIFNNQQTIFLDTSKIDTLGILDKTHNFLLVKNTRITRKISKEATT